MNKTKIDKKCNCCQGFGAVLNARGFVVELDDNNLCVSYHDSKTNVGSSWAKKIKYCPICGRQLLEAKT
jgi:hypothetical protein